MNCRVFVFFTGIGCCVCTSLFAAPFQNLDFEQGSFQAPPANYVPSDPLAGPNPISAAAGLPFWTAREDSTVCTAIWGNGGALDETSVALFNAAFNQLDGNYCVQLSAVSFAPSGFFKTSSISQTGDVPANAQSIQFLKIDDGGPAPTNAFVTLNGSVINLVPIATNGNVVTMAGDVSAFAGTNAELTITSAGAPGGVALAGENYLTLDDISFSPNPVPEPSALVLLAVGGVIAFAAKRRRSALHC